MTKYSLIQLKIQTKEHLKKIGTKGQTYDEVISELIRNKSKNQPLDGVSAEPENRSVT
jgi:hypothetical protein